MQPSEIQIIGHVQSCYPDKFGTPRQPGLARQSRAFLKILPKFQPEQALEGLEKFSHIWALFLFHKNNTARFHAKVHPPRLEGESIGVFATRSPHRPSPIGLSLLEIEKVEKDGVWVRGVDLIDKTPLLDLKPYLKEVESKPEAISGWASEAVHKQVTIEWAPACEEFLKAYEKERQPVRTLIEETLALDPRPLTYRGYESTESPYRSIHAVRFYDLDVHFRFLDAHRLRVEDIKGPNLL